MRQLEWLRPSAARRRTLPTRVITSAARPAPRLTCSCNREGTSASNYHLCCPRQARPGPGLASPGRTLAGATITAKVRARAGPAATAPRAARILLLLPGQTVGQTVGPR